TIFVEYERSLKTLKEVYAEVFQFRGTHRAFGEFQGEKLLSSPLLANRKKQWGPRKERHFNIDSEVFTSKMKQLAQGIIDEIEELDNVVELHNQDAIRLVSSYYIEFRRSGCYVYADPRYIVRNYDRHPRSYERHYVFNETTDGGYAHVGPAMQVTGRVDGINE